MSSDVIDLEAVKERLDNDREFFVELLQVLIREVPGYLERIGGGINSKNSVQVYEAAHGLKSALGSLGSIKGQRCSQELEQIGRRGELEVAHAKLSELKAAIEEFLGVARRIENGEIW